MGVRAKMRLTEMFRSGALMRLHFTSQYEPAISEALRFQKASPRVTADLLLDDPAAMKQFERGADYYVVFTPAPQG